jgi:protein-disulfide isomerase
MAVSRRVLLGIGGSAIVAAGAFAAWRITARTPVLAQSAPPTAAPEAATPAPAGTTGDQRFTQRSVGKPDAPVSVTEWFSLTCPHCARFSRDVMPQIQSQLIDTGKVQLIFGDFPLDQVALTAAMVARYLPPDRYRPFCDALLAAQDRWAFARNVNSAEELAKMAALAGLSRDSFDKAIADTQLRDWILKRQDEGSKVYGVDSTPTFIFNGPAAKNHREAGEQSYDAFARMAAAAAG